MAGISALNSGIQGILRGMQGANKAAAEIASPQAERSAADLAKPMVELLAERTQVQASAKVVKTASDMIGTLFDDKA